MFEIPLRPLKRARYTAPVDGDDNLQNVDDPQEVFGNQSLPVAELPVDFDGTPLDGEQYLATVRMEAASYPSVYYAANNPYATAASTSANGQHQTGEEAHAALLEQLSIPSLEWRQTFMKKFYNMRQSLSLPPTQKVSYVQDKLPKRRDERAWYIWIHGRIPPDEEEELLAKEKEKKAVSGHDDDDMDMGGDTDQEESISANGKKIPRHWKIKEPSGGAVKRLTTDQTLELLEAFPYWLAHKTIIPTDGTANAVIQPLHARWLFSLLAWLDSRLMSEQISTLRTLARACIAAISMSRMRRKALKSRRNAYQQEGEFGSTEDDEAGAWMVVTIVSGVWGQSDLWEDALTDMRRSA